MNNVTSINVSFSIEIRLVYFLAEYIDHSWHIIRCDLQELLINPNHHVNHDRFLIFTEPSTISTSAQNSSSLSLPIYQFKALNFIKQTDYCISMIFGMVK
ncbi:unnamed protein product [Rotaria magnacalcarata]|uniref:Uncharacterized protein n=1 Tax=Rotaria magnacalcarata TaxID=392030 RepID=A0A8S3IH45_9BILA|nr:unnamed protein product [Rotaria magnacalcarata]